MIDKWEEIIEKINLPNPEQKVFIWGAGNTSVLNHQGMIRANLYKRLNITAFLDMKLAGTLFYGFSVLNPEILEQEKPEKVYVLISTTNPKVYSEIKSICDAKHIESCLVDSMILKLHRTDYLKATAIMDEISQSIYQQILTNRALALNTYATLHAGESYFGIPEFCISSPSDIVVDCGAYVGDSAERFIWNMDKFKQYIAIEPDSDNYEAMLIRFDRLRKEWNIPDDKLVALYGGVSDKTAKLGVETRCEGLSSIVNADSQNVEFWALDDLLKEKITFIKADIESYEYNMLLGARESIKKYHPRMAICIYHNMVDMYSIPLLIHEIEPNYQLSVRHHSFGCEETVLYAY